MQLELAGFQALQKIGVEPKTRKDGRIIGVMIPEGLGKREWIQAVQVFGDLMSQKLALGDLIEHALQTFQSPNVKRSISDLGLTNVIATNDALCARWIVHAMPLDIRGEILENAQSWNHCMEIWRGGVTSLDEWKEWLNTSHKNDWPVVELRAQIRNERRKQQRVFEEDEETLTGTSVELLPTFDRIKRYTNQPMEKVFPTPEDAQRFISSYADVFDFMKAVESYSRETVVEEDKA